MMFHCEKLAIFVAIAVGVWPVGSMHAVEPQTVVKPVHQGKTSLGHADFDGDGLADPVQYCYSNGLWTAYLSVSGYGMASVEFGGETCSPVACDYDGDGKADPAIYNTTDAMLTVLLSGYGYAPVSLTLSDVAAVPIAGDFDGDRRADPAIYQEGTGLWTVYLSTWDYSPASLALGGVNDSSVAGDYDGDGRTDPAIYQTTSGLWSACLSSCHYALVSLEGFGGTGFTPVVGDFDGDRRADPTIYSAVVADATMAKSAQATTGAWRARLSICGYAEFALNGFGGTNEVPIVGDYDGDGRADPAVYSEPAGTLSVRFSGGNYVANSLTQTNRLHADSRLISAARVNDENTALLYCDYPSDFDYGNFRYQVISYAGTVIRDEEVMYDNQPIEADHSATMVMNGSEPHIFVAYLYSDIVHIFQSGSVWTQENVGNRQGYSSLIVACRDDSQSFHLLIDTTFSTNDYFLLKYITNRQGSWESEELRLTKNPTMRLLDKDMAVDAQGNAHITVSLQDQIGDTVTWPGYLYYLSNQTGIWSTELVAYQSHSQWDAAYHHPSIAVNADGMPAIASHLRYNVMTGSDALSQLVYSYRTGAGSWTTEMIADTADNYFGTDGGHFTGIDPTLAFDRNLGAHIIFSDLASSHVSGYEQAVSGQIRYARNQGTGWSLVTLFRQSAADQQGVINKFLLLSEDGLGLHLVAGISPGYYVVHFSNHRQAVFRF